VLFQLQVEVGNIYQLVAVLQVEVMMRTDPSIKVGFVAVDTNPPQQSRFGQLVERVVNGGERDRGIGSARAEWSTSMVHRQAGDHPQRGLRHDTVPHADTRQLLHAVGSVRLRSQQDAGTQ